VKPPALYLHQAKFVGTLCRLLADGHQRVLLQGPTGSGKSTVTVFALSKLLGSRDFTQAVIAVPQEQIKASFMTVKGRFLNPLDAYKSEGTVTFGRRVIGDYEDDGVPVNFFRRDKGLQKTNQLAIHLVSKSQKTELVYVTTHAALRESAGTIDMLPPDGLRGKILVLDEAHYASVYDVESDALQTRTGEFVDKWVSKGGVVIYLTATPFRTDLTSVVPIDTPRISRSMITHAREGFAPPEFKIKVVITGRPSTVEANAIFQGTVLTGPAAYVEEWEAQGRPFSAMIVPTSLGESEEWAEELVRLLAEAGETRVLNAVGVGHKEKKILPAGLSEYRNLMERCKAEGRRPTVDEIPYRIIIAAHRLNEGTDYPPFSHVFCPNIPRSFRLGIQRLGRTTRLKTLPDGSLFIDGYLPEHAQAASMTFFVFNLKDEAILDKGQFQADYHTYVVQLLTFLEQVEAGSLVAEHRVRLEEHHKRHPPKTIPEAIAAALEARKPEMSDDVNAKILVGDTPGVLGGLVGQSIEGALATGTTPTAAQLAETIDLDAPEAKDTLEVLGNQLLIQGVSGVSQGIIEAKEKGRQEFVKVLREGYSNVEATLAQKRVEDAAMKEVILKYGHHTLPALNGILTRCTADEAREITRAIIGKFGGGKLLREPVIYQAVKDFEAQEGRPPGINDVLVFGDFRIARSEIDTYGRLGTVGLVEGRVVADMVKTGDLLATIPPHRTREEFRALLEQEVARTGRLLPVINAASIPTDRLHELKRGWDRDNATDVNLQILSHAAYHGWTDYPAETRLREVADLFGLLRTKERVKEIQAAGIQCAPGVTKEGFQKDIVDAGKAPSNTPPYDWTIAPTEQEHKAAITRYFEKRGKIPGNDVALTEATPFYDEKVRARNPGTFLWRDCIRECSCPFSILANSLRPASITRAEYDQAEARYMQKHGKVPPRKESASPYLPYLMTWVDADKRAV